MEDKQKGLQEMLIKLETQRKQLDAVNKQIQLLNATMNEMVSTEEAMDSLKENREGTEILVSIGSNSFIKAALKDNKNVLVGVGAGISIEKSVDEAKKTLEKRKKDVETTMEKLVKSSEGLAESITRINQEAEKLVNEIQRKDVQLPKGQI